MTDKLEHHQATVRRDVRKTTALILLIFALVGGVLVALSFALPEEHHFWREFCKELGIVLLAVCGVSIVYEVFVAERHFKQFFSNLQTQIERGESNSAVCERLGIREIFPTRDLYEAKYPLMQQASVATAGSTFRVIARTLYLMMNKPEAIKRTIAQGAHVQLCFFDPEIDSPALRDIAELETFDTIAALATFRKQFARWLEETKPSGSVEIRYHQIQLFDSFFSFVAGGESLAVWDLSFGRDISAKRIVLVDSTKGLGADLDRRYNLIWEQAIPQFSYSNKRISLDRLPH